MATQANKPDSRVPSSSKWDTARKYLNIFLAAIGNAWKFGAELAGYVIFWAFFGLNWIANLVTWLTSAVVRDRVIPIGKHILLALGIGGLVLWLFSPASTDVSRGEDFSAAVYENYTWGSFAQCPGTWINTSAASWQSDRSSHLTGGTHTNPQQQRDWLENQCGVNFVGNPAEVRALLATGELVEIDPSFRLRDVDEQYVAPLTHIFMWRLREQYRDEAQCGELTFTSAMRNEDRNGTIRGASPDSAHMSGYGIDAEVPQDGRCRQWLEEWLLDHEQAGRIDANLEVVYPHYHVTIVPGAYEAYVEGLAEESWTDWFWNLFDWSSEDDDESVATFAELDYEVLDLPQNPMALETYSTESLAGRQAGDLYALYLDYPGTTVPASVSINWADRLEALWAVKEQRSGLSPAARDMMRDIVGEYRGIDVDRISIETYEVIADHQIGLICEHLDWSSVQQNYRLDSNEARVLQEQACGLSGEALMAYFMAEILPSDDGDLNVGFVRFLLQNGGREFVERMPAVNDDLTSFGPMQFTSNAVYDMGNPSNRDARSDRGNDDVRGASIVNRSLPSDLKIPSSTGFMRGDDHFRAGFLFVIHNLADAIRNLDADELNTLDRIGASHTSELTQFVAVAHNKPAYGRRYLGAWLADGGTRPFVDYCDSGPSRLYAVKTRNNLRALQALS